MLWHCVASKPGLWQFTSKKVYLFIPIWENWYKEQPPLHFWEPSGFNVFLFLFLRVEQGRKLNVSSLPMNFILFFPILSGLVFKISSDDKFI